MKSNLRINPNLKIDCRYQKIIPYLKLNSYLKIYLKPFEKIEVFSITLQYHSQMFSWPDVFDVWGFH